MSELISIQVGQCGNQIGSTFWPLLIKEYEHLESQKRQSFGNLSSFFYPVETNEKSPNYGTNDIKNGNLKARSLLVDMENSVVESIEKSSYGHIFDKKSVLINYPGSGNNWAVGYCEHGAEQYDEIEEMLRFASEKCDRLHGFLSFFSLAGGTGSGLGSCIQGILSDFYTRTDRIVACVHPGDQYDVITTPYNVAFSTNQLIEHASCVIPVDNTSLLNMTQHFGILKDEQKSKPYRNMNCIIAKMMLHLTSGARFHGSLNWDIGDLVSNMVPFPRLNFLSTSLSPIVLTKPNVRVNKRSSDILIDFLSKQNHLIKWNPMGNKVLAASLLGRGSISVTSFNQYSERLKKECKFVGWCESVKTGVCSVASPDHPSSLLCLTNSTSMKTVFKEILIHFDRLYKRKAHVHHYKQVDNFPDDHFESTRESLMEVISSYDNSTYEVSIPRIDV